MLDPLERQALLETRDRLVHRVPLDQLASRDQQDSQEQPEPRDLRVRMVWEEQLGHQDLLDLLVAPELQEQPVLQAHRVWSVPQVRLVLRVNRASKVNQVQLVHRVNRVAPVLSGLKDTQEALVALGPLVHREYVVTLDSPGLVDSLD